MPQKRKSVNDRGDSQHPSKKVRVKSSSTPKAPKPAKSVKKSSAATTKKTKTKKSTAREVPDTERRRSGRAMNVNQSYMERDSDDDDEEMLDGVAEWTYENEGDDSGSGSEGEEASGGEEEEEVSVLGGLVRHSWRL